jgi:hypothetical protein
LPGARSKPRKRKTKKLLSEADLLELGRKHFATDFPNPKRQGCPPKNALQLLADNPRKADDSVLNHISFCSPCYRNFSRFLNARKSKRRPKSKRGH